LGFSAGRWTELSHGIAVVNAWFTRIRPAGFQRGWKIIQGCRADLPGRKKAFDRRPVEQLLCRWNTPDDAIALIAAQEEGS
jgi:hypothetical protein